MTTTITVTDNRHIIRKEILYVKKMEQAGEEMEIGFLQGEENIFIPTNSMREVVERIEDTS